MKKIVAFVFLVTFISGCKTSTEITGSWMNPRIPSASYEHIIVAALTNNVNAKTTVEDELAEALMKQGVRVTKSSSLFAPNFTEAHDDKEEMLSKFREAGGDAILTVSLIDKEMETRYVPGAYGYEPVDRFGYYGAFWGYYSFWYPRIYSPGYYTTDKTYFIETNLYDTNTEELIWSAQSETYNPNNLSSFSEEFAQAIVEKMEEDNIIPKDAIVRDSD